MVIGGKLPLEKGKKARAKKASAANGGGGDGEGGIVDSDRQL